MPPCPWSSLKSGSSESCRCRCCSCTAPWSGRRDAETALDSYDRPLSRRKHRTIIDNAKHAIENLPDQIRSLEGELADADRGVPELTKRVELLETVASQVPDLADEHEDNTQQLRYDQAITNPGLDRPALFDEITTPDRPNQNLLDALDQIHTIGRDGPDLGIGL